MSLIKTISIFSLAAAASLGLAACGDDGDGGGGGGDTTIDPNGTHTKYVISELVIPSNPTQASNVALDLDGDGFKDNALGGLLASLSSGAADLNLQAQVDEQLATGAFILLASVKATDLVNANGVGTYVYFGENPKPAACTTAGDPTTCGKHLSGSASFDIAGNSPSDAVISGTLAGGELQAGPGSVSIELPLGAGDPLQLDLIAAHIEVGVSASGLSAGKLGGAITEADVDDKLMPAIQKLVADLITENCTPVGKDCGCVAGSAGQSVLSFFDANEDCKIPLDELMSHSVIDATLRNPDLDLFDASGKFNPNSDGVKDSLSLAVGFTAVGASFTLPSGI